MVWEYDSRSVCSEPVSWSSLSLLFMYVAITKGSRGQVKWNPEAVRDQGAAGVLVLQRKPEISLDVSQRQVINSYHDTLTRSNL